MANDRLYLYCKACKTLGPMVAKDHGSGFSWWGDEEGKGEKCALFLDSHGMGCVELPSSEWVSRMASGDHWVGLTNENGAAYAEAMRVGKVSPS